MRERAHSAVDATAPRLRVASPFGPAHPARFRADGADTGTVVVMEEFERQEAEEVVPDVDSDPVAAVTAPTPWWKKTNPATGRNYISVEEYDRVPRHADQTCKNSQLDKLQEEKDLLNRSVPPLDPKSPGSWNDKKMAKVPCSRIRQRLEAQKKLLEKRWQIQKECFGGKPDPSHENAITEVEKAFANTRKLQDQNCAPGHPMAER